MNGMIKKEFEVPSRSGLRKYVPGGRPCSQVVHLLELLEKQTATKSDLIGDLKQIYSHIEFICSSPNAKEIIGNEWRNPSVHGASDSTYAYGIVINIILLIAMDHVQTDLRKELG